MAVAELMRMARGGETSHSDVSDDKSPVAQEVVSPHLTRVLKRTDFEAVFSRSGTGWRLLVLVDQVAGDGVIYRQLDAHRQPIGAPRKMATSVLLANFVSEAAAF